METLVGSLTTRLNQLASNLWWTWEPEVIGIVARQDVVRALRRAAAGEGPRRRRTGPHGDCGRAAAAPGRAA